MNNLLKNTLLTFKVDALIRANNRCPRIVFWHGVDDRINSEVEQEIFDVEIFEKQIAYISKHFEIVSIEEFEKRYLADDFTGREVVLTFDDGYANNLYKVQPILNRLGLSFSVFVSTDNISNGEYFPTSVNRIIVKGADLQEINIPSQQLHFSVRNDDERGKVVRQISDLLKTKPLDEVKQITNDLISNVSQDVWEALKEKYKSVRPMTWDEVRELHKKGATIGSHCQQHICCHDNQNEDVLEQQIKQSKQIIEKELGAECRYFAYPNGNFTTFSNKCVEDSYALGFSTKGRERITSQSQKAIIPRIGLPITLNTFKLLINLFPRK